MNLVRTIRYDFSLFAAPVEARPTQSTNVVSRFLAARAERARVAETISALGAMDDAALADIGVSRSELISIARNAEARAHGRAGDADTRAVA